MQQLKQQTVIEVEKEDLVKAGTARDPLDLVAFESLKSKRVSKKPQRFSEAKFVNGKALYAGDEGYTDAEDDDYRELRKSSRVRKMRGKRSEDVPVGSDFSDENKEEGSRNRRTASRCLRKRPLDDDFSIDEDDDSSDGDGSSDEFDDDDSAAGFADSDAESGGNETGEKDVNISTAAEKRKERKEAREAFHREEQEDEGVRQLRLLLTADASKDYKIEDLKNEAVLTRGLEIVYCLRIGQQPDKVPSIHINYDAIDHTLDDKVKAQIKMDESATLLQDILTAQTTFAPDKVLQPPAANVPALKPISPGDDGEVEVEYVEMKAADLRLLLSKRGRSLKGAETKEAFIQLLQNDDLRREQAFNRATTEKKKAYYVKWAISQFTSDDTASPLRVPDYENMEEEELRKRCAKFGLTDTTRNHQRLVEAIHEQNMHICSQLDYDEVPSKYLNMMALGRGLISAASSASRDKLIAQLQADDIHCADRKQWETKYVVIDLNKPWVQWIVREPLLEALLRR